ncbi:MAG: 1-deoxy-D-xylulose-5-phosphate synthase [Candidatus Marinimicrobia bacterium]|nr:1-deoxy-D-xylulose-5-phosphate synthase [Candidatus Neomarinimicrobiota bacterium]MCF7828997.1 1-deoxy-D-xylulose-5-phosphate synthase [Candidatus Neomarinimicrobiota bacterium]MCF7879957.1 1-deoxy-D-xylulose-5-phosphate synthase [Candidatus Neomarinimicrobiota bacterium]
MDYSILPNIDSPKDLKSLERSELRQVCDELRDYVIEVVDTVGGHLAPTLGVIELTTALHYLYDTPRDKIVWDVGHQAYAHKVLTGRRDRLNTIRQLNGLAPFCKREESEYDPFGAGHASTAISAALGIATARDLQNEDYRVAAIIGDGAITGGLAYEGLNNAGAMRRQMTIILNDNEMSISPNVGAMHHLLTKMVTNPFYNKIRDEMWNLTGKIPGGSRYVRYIVRKMEEGLKNFLTPGMLFEELGFRYFGPINGHDLDEVIETFDAVKDLKTPALVHVLTEKGKGYPGVEKSPVRFHSIKSKASRESKKEDQLPYFYEVFGNIVTEMAADDEKLVAITPAMREGSGLVKFSDTYPERYFDVGIAEGHAVTFAAGLAAEGIHPVVAIYSSFLQRGYDHLVHDVATQELPVIICLDRSGLVGGDGATHQGAFDYSYMLHIPNMVVTAPMDGNELRDLMYTARQYGAGPFSIRYPKDRVVEWSPEGEPHLLDIGSWEELREGDKIVVVAAGSMVDIGERAIESLAKEGYQIGLVNARFLKPFDTTMLSNLVKSCSHLVIMEENSVIGGFGSTILGYVEDNFPGTVRITRIGIPDQFIEHGSREEVLALAGLSPAKIADRLREIARMHYQSAAEVS